MPVQSVNTRDAASSTLSPDFTKPPIRDHCPFIGSNERLYNKTFNSLLLNPRMIQSLRQHRILLRLDKKLLTSFYGF